MVRIAILIEVIVSDWVAKWIGRFGCSNAKNSVDHEHAVTDNSPCLRSYRDKEHGIFSENKRPSPRQAEVAASGAGVTVTPDKRTCPNKRIIPVSIRHKTGAHIAMVGRENGGHWLSV